MNTFEIQPARSRNWEIEEEEEETSQSIELPLPKLTINNNNNAVDCTNKTIIIANKEAPAIFIRSYFPINELIEIGEITLDDIKSNKTSEVMLNNRCLLYSHSIHKDLIIIVSQFSVPADRSFNFAKLILNHFHSCNSILILDSMIDSHYQTFNHQHPIPPFIRSLYTNTFENKFSLIPLESPNLVERLTASLLTLGQIEKIPSCSLVSIVESYINIESIQAFESYCTLILPKIFNQPPSIKRDSNKVLTDRYKKNLQLVNKLNDRGFYI